MDRSGGRLAVALCAALVVLASLPVGAGAASTDGPTADPRPVDVIYLTEDGDAVLEYRTSVPDATTTARTGLTTGERLLELLVAEESGVPTDVAGVDATLSPGAVVGSSLADVDPGALRSLSFRSAAAQTADRSGGNLSLSATVATPDAEGGTVTTSGRAEVGPESYVYAGRVAIETDDADQSDAAVSLAETDDGYRLTVERSRIVQSTDADWDSRANASATLAERYGNIAARFDGERTVNVARYDRTATGEGTRLDLAYTVRFRGIERALSERLARDLAAERDLALSDAETRAVGERIAATDVQRVAATVTTESEQVAVDWTVRIDDYAELPDAVLAVARSQDDLSDGARAALSSYGDRLDARREAGLARIVSWNGSLSATDGATDISLSVVSATDGWAAYVREMAARDDRPISFTYGVDARTEGGRVVADATVTLRGAEVVQQLGGTGLAGLENAGRAGAVAEALREAGFDRARMDVTVGADSVSARGGARFDDLSAFAPLVEASVAGQLRSVAARAASDERASYVRVPGLVGANPTREEVRALPIVDADTEIRLPGEWDREFPSMPVRSPAAVIDERTRPAPTAGSRSRTGDGDGRGGLPGFGPPVALAALAGGLLALRRRRR